ncbi:MAG TPA: hypothetical protein VNU19_06860 [Candidatus Acidoferrum sp.]|nr:hypothetical protein [Candidatus Acidoferrum sp.]
MTTAIASASNSPRLPVPFQPFPVSCPSGFIALDSVIRENEYETVKVLANGDTVQFFSGVVVEKMTNETTGKSVNFNASGTVKLTIYTDGSGNVVSNGPNMIGFITPGLASEFGVPILGMYYGTSLVTLDSTGFPTAFSFSGRVTDVCAALS